MVLTAAMPIWLVKDGTITVVFDQIIYFYLSFVSYAVLALRPEI
jgi:hypothetical protein